MADIGSITPAAPLASDVVAGSRSPAESWRPLVTFLLLTFAITWAAWIPAALFVPFATPDASISLPFMVLQTVGAAGPSLAAIFILRRTYRGAWRPPSLFGRYRKWRVGAGWWLIAALLVPALTLFAAGLRFVVLGEPPGRGSNLGLMLADVGLAGILPTLLPQLAGNMLSSPLLEELGWRGYALPHLQERMAALPAAVVLGFIWGLWHLPIWIAQGTVLPYALGLIVLHSILMTCLFNATGGSLLLAMVFHASLNVSLTSFASATPNPFEFGLTLLVTVAVLVRFGARDLAVKGRTRWSDVASGARSVTDCDR